MSYTIEQVVEEGKKTVAAKLGCKAAIEKCGHIWEDTGSTDAGLVFSTYPSKIEWIIDNSGEGHKVTYNVTEGVTFTPQTLKVYDDGAVYMTVGVEDWYTLDSVTYTVNGAEFTPTIKDNQAIIEIHKLIGDLEITAEATYYGTIPVTDFTVRVDSETGMIEVPRYTTWTILFDDITPADYNDNFTYSIDDDTVAKLTVNGNVATLDWLVSDKTAVITINAVNKFDETDIHLTKTVTIHTEESSRVDCETIDFTLEGYSSNENDELIIPLIDLDGTNGNNLILKATVYPEVNDDLEETGIIWTLSPKLPVNMADDLRYYYLRSANDGTITVPYSAYSSGAFATASIRGYQKYVLDNGIVLNDSGTLRASGEDILPFTVTNDATDKLKAILNMDFDGRMLLTATCGSATVTKIICLYNDINIEAGVSTGQVNIADDIATQTLAGNGFYKQVTQNINRLSPNPFITLCQTGDEIEIWNNRPGTTIGSSSEEGYIKYGFTPLSLTYSTAGYPTLNWTWDSITESERYGYSFEGQQWPIYRMMDPGWSPAAAETGASDVYTWWSYIKWVIVDDSANGYVDGLEMYYTNTVGDDGKPVYDDDHKVSFTGGAKIAVPGRCQTTTVNISTKAHIDGFGLVFTNGTAGVSTYIDVDGTIKSQSLQSNTQQKLLVDWFRSHVRVLKNGVTVFGNYSPEGYVEDDAVVYNLTGVESSNTAESATVGSSYTTTLSVEDEYKEPLTVTVKMKGVDVTSSVYDEDTKTITISSVTGRIVITAVATEMEYTVDESSIQQNKTVVSASDKSVDITFNGTAS